jgi:hypothetical protein
MLKGYWHESEAVGRWQRSDAGGDRKTNRYQALKKDLCSIKIENFKN